jgi:hypothetical protein
MMASVQAGIYGARRRGKTSREPMLRNPNVSIGPQPIGAVFVAFFIQLLLCSRSFASADDPNRGETLDDFLEGFPTVSSALALDALEEPRQLLFFHAS